MGVEMVAHDGESLDPVVDATEIGRVNPAFPVARGVALGVELGRPLQKPEHVHAILRVFDGASHDGVLRQRTDLDLNGHGDAAYDCAYIGSDVSKRTLQSEIGDTRFFLQGQIDFQFATTMSVAFALGEFAGNRVGVGEVVDTGPARFEDDFLVAFEAEKRGVSFRLHVGGHDLAV